MFKDQIKALRTKKELTQEDLATKLNISRQSISKWENGLSYPTKTMLHQLSEVFEIPIKDLLDPDELMLISIDNNAKIVNVRRRTMLILSIVLVILIGSVVLGLLLNNRIDQIELNGEEIIVHDPLVGFIFVGQNALSSYDQIYGSDIYDLLDSGIYPYAYYNMRNAYSYWDEHKVYQSLTSISQNGIDVDGTVYIKRSDEPTMYYMVAILYDVETDDIYLGSGSGFGTNLSQTALNKQMTSEYSDLLGVVHFSIDIKFVDELNEVSVNQYDESYQLIDSTIIDSNNPISLDPETLYFVIRETYTDLDGESYILKFTVDYHDFNNYYYFYTMQISTDEMFPEYQAIVFNTYLT